MSARDLKVLHLRSSCGVYGAERVILSLARHQPALGVRPIVVDFRRPGDDEGPFLRAAAEQGSRALPLPCRGRLDLKAVRALRQLAIREEVDVFHGHDYKANFYGYLALRRLPISLVATNHLWDRRGFRLALYQRIDVRVLRRFDHVIAVASPVAEEMARRGIPRDSVTVVLNGLDVSPIQSPMSLSEKRHLLEALRIPGDRRIVGSVGRLEPQKGYDILLSAFARLDVSGSNLHLLIVGDGSLRNELTARAQQLGVLDRVTLAGVRSDVPRLLSMLSLFVCSSRDEGMPIAVLEAAASGLPIVATAVGDVPCLIEDGVTGRLVEPGDPAKLASAMGEVLSDPATATVLGTAARNRVQGRLSARQTATQTVHGYRRALERFAGRTASMTETLR